MRILKQLHLFYYTVSLSLCFISGLNCATSIDFIPNENFTEENLNYSKTNLEEVEVISERPKLDFRIVGSVIFRNFVRPNDMNSEIYALKKEMYRLKIDGIWIYKKSLESIPPLIINTQNQDGMTVAYTETNKEMGKLTGYTFRYRKKYEFNSKKIR